VQAAVDRRFYRSRVSSEETLAQFGARLRREADLDTLVSELHAVVGQTMSPAHASLWLRTDGGVLRNDPEMAAQ
jgi:hypothetical protein